MEFSELVKLRYAVKKFDGKMIPKEKVDELLDIVRFAASSYNLQPWKISSVSDKKTKQLLQDASYGQVQVGSSSHVLIFSADTNLEGLIAGIEKQMNAGNAAQSKSDNYIATLRDFAKGMDREKRTTWAQRQLYLALGNALNGAKSLGFDSSPMEGFEAAKVSKILNLPKNLVPTALVPIGYAADIPREKIRFTREQILA